MVIMSINLLLIGFNLTIRPIVGRIMKWF